MTDEILDSNGLNEKDFLEQYKKKNYKRPYLTADIVLVDPNKNKVLLIKRKGHPYINKYALPGGFAKESETIEESAIRELKEETLLDAGVLYPVKLYSKPDRDPRGWVVSQAFLVMTDSAQTNPQGGDDAMCAQWFKFKKEGEDLILSSETDDKIVLKGSIDLAFDHLEMIKDAISLSEKIIKGDAESHALHTSPVV